MAKKWLIPAWLISIVAIIGCLNWGLIAINPSWDLVAMLLGSNTIWARLVYGLVGIAGLGLMWILYKMHK